MNALLLTALTAVALGLLHALDPDHLVAVSVFVSQQPERKKAVGFALRWGLGHTAVVALVGGAAIAFKFAITPWTQNLAEVLVGILLLVIGAWGMTKALHTRSIHIHRHEWQGHQHVHFHSHSQGAGHEHQHAMFFVGAAHGLAGTASILLIIPLALSSSVTMAALYILLFGAGTIAAMACFAILLSSAMKPLGTRWTAAIQACAAGVSMLTGVYWIAERTYFISSLLE